MDMSSISIDGVDLSQFLIVTDVDKGLGPELLNDSIDNKKTAGSRLKSFRYGSRMIMVSFKILKETKQKKLAIQKILYKPGVLKVIFWDEPDRYFLAKINGRANFKDVTWDYAVGSFELKCFDPFAYSINEKAATRSNNILTFVNNGTAECYPVFEFQARSDLTMFGLTHPNKRVIQYGYEDNVVRIKAGQQVKIHSADCSVYVAGVKVYPTPMSQSFAIQPGTTEIAYMVNQKGTLMPVSTTFREAYL